MITPIVSTTALAGGINVISDVRHRASAGERPMLADSTPATPKTPTASNNGQFPNETAQGRTQHDAPPTRDRTSTFAAAVIAGTLSPTPQTMEQLIIRIGASTIPEESQARLKDLIA